MPFTHLLLGADISECVYMMLKCVLLCVYIVSVELQTFRSGFRLEGVIRVITGMRPVGAMSFLYRNPLISISPNLHQTGRKVWTSICCASQEARKGAFTEEEYLLQNQSSSRAEWAASVRYQGGCGSPAGET